MSLTDYEKKTEHVKIYCTPSQKKRWESRFGFAEIGHAVRNFLDGQQRDPRFRCHKCGSENNLIFPSFPKLYGVPQETMDKYVADQLWARRDLIICETCSKKKTA